MWADWCGSGTDWWAWGWGWVVDWRRHAWGRAGWWGWHVFPYMLLALDGGWRRSWHWWQGHSWSLRSLVMNMMVVNVGHVVNHLWWGWWWSTANRCAHGGTWCGAAVSTWISVSLFWK